MAEEEEAPPEEESRTRKIIKLILHILLHIILITYFIWCSYIYFTYDQKGETCYKPDSPDEENTVDKNTTVTKPLEKPFKPHILCEMNWCIGYGFLVILFVLFYICWIYYILFKPFVGQKLYDNQVEPGVEKWIEFSRKTVVSIIMLIVVFVFMILVLIFESRNEPVKLVGVTGPILFIMIGFAASKHRRDIPWRIVVHGILGQFILAVVCIRLAHGRAMLNCVGAKVVTFLGYSRAGALFVYGDRIVQDFVFAFAILAVIFFFSVVTSCLYYLGVMQFFLRAFGWLLQATIGTTVCESVNAAGNVFLGMSESPLMIRPYISKLTNSELHAVCTSGYCTVAGTVLGAYIAFGASAAYLITASVMAAPASLAFAKLFLPEVEESVTRSDNIELEKSTDSSLLDAATSGASNALAIVLGIVANIIAFIAIVAFLDAVVEWSFELGGQTGINFIWILTQMFVPLVLVMGVPFQDCQKVAKVVAEKSIINEFIGYQHLGEMIRNGELEPRSQGIATFALCGFANPGSLGILIAALSAMAPDRRTDITKVAIRAFFAGSFVSFTSASFAGILIQDDMKF